MFHYALCRTIRAHTQYTIKVLSDNTFLSPFQLPHACKIRLSAYANALRTLSAFQHTHAFKMRPFSDRVGKFVFQRGRRIFLLCLSNFDYKPVATKYFYYERWKILSPNERVKILLRRQKNDYKRRLAWFFYYARPDVLSVTSCQKASCK